MSPNESLAPLNSAILEDAATWFISFNEGELDSGGRERLHHWLRRSPEHVRAYLEVAAAWEDAARIRGQQPVDQGALIAAARADSKVVALKSPSRGEHLEKPVDRASRAWALPRWFIHAGLAASLATVAVLAVRWSDWNTYSTAVGEQRTLALADGSTVELNAHSRLRIRFSASERTVDLLEGQALFHVKKNSARPFVVISNGARVRAVGTQFDVYRKPIGTVVTVIEGRVAVTSPQWMAAAKLGSSGRGSGGTSTSQQADARHEDTQRPVVPGSASDPTAPLVRSVQSNQANSIGTPIGEVPVLLSAGEQVTVSGRAPARPVAANLGAAIAWTQRKLVFDETALPEAVAEFNRYNTRRIVLEDPAVTAYHIRGTFDSDDPDRLIQFLRERFNAKVTESGHEIRISSGH